MYKKLLHPKCTSSFSTAHVMLSLFLLLSITGCFNEASENDATPKIFEASLIENLPETTQEESVTITLRTHPNADIYLHKARVATSDDTGVAHIKLLMQANKEISSFELSVRDGSMKSKTLYSLV